MCIHAQFRALRISLLYEICELADDFFFRRISQDEFLRKSRELSLLLREINVFERDLDTLP